MSISKRYLLERYFDRRQTMYNTRYYNAYFQLAMHMHTYIIGLPKCDIAVESLTITLGFHKPAPLIFFSKNFLKNFRGLFNSKIGYRLQIALFFLFDRNFP